MRQGTVSRLNQLFSINDDDRHLLLADSDVPESPKLDRGSMNDT